MPQVDFNFCFIFCLPLYISKWWSSLFSEPRQFGPYCWNAVTEMLVLNIWWSWISVAILCIIFLFLPPLCSNLQKAVLSKNWLLPVMCFYVTVLQTLVLVLRFYNAKLVPSPVVSGLFGLLRFKVFPPPRHIEELLCHIVGLKDYLWSNGLG